ncbi:conserved hypothetical protein [Histoplasma capsulatum G186AR]|uniref:GDS1 winged helix domain-containing protein n=2 Tax=Ajellomyces capsulatus TaxID=5037 RepID=C0NV59_AJECG|nr:uncharacterized protein HCBG_06823 [Histoplasma capsulatum G186AR]EEH04872.1 conserved hypothetical protein [Histoplasma capsulatum G186AR]KAG5287529.1 hypothetical protein I7I52_11328 [Histoplasma capsulatum]QSS70657.1 hypothetical protein I7I50_12360 [Histoplasma capsulatum G186AR]
MPYNTRRKSLSLPSLGIHLPSASRSHRTPTAPKIPSPSDTQQPPSKKVKRSHDSPSQSPASVSPESQESNSHRAGDLLHGPSPKSHRGGAGGTYEHTPPPSPAPDTGLATRIDTDGINDDVVVAVIEQLEKTGNRPHLIKELATVLSNTNETVANSANAAALLSSRLSLYLKRPWTALAPCPIVKKLIPVHPRKVFFYLATSPPQELPDTADGMLTPTTESKRITPSISDPSIDPDDADEDLARERARLSPSPEVDLSAPEFDDEDEHSAPGGPHASTRNYGVRGNLSNLHHHHRLSYNHRSTSPPLEGDEKEFTQTASSVRERTSSEEVAARRRQDLEKDDRPQHHAADGQKASGPSGDVEMEGASTSHNGSNHQETDYADFFTSHMLQNPSQDQHLDDASAATTLFGASPSPSVSSELSTLSSASSATSHSETEADLPMDTNKAVTTEGISSGALNGGNDVTATIGRGISSTGISGAAAGLAKGVKRSITLVDVAETNSAMEADTRRMDDGDISKSFDTVDPTAANTILDKSALTFGHTLELIKPTMDLDTEMGAGAGVGLGLGLELESWTDLPSPETVEVDELDAMFANV